jgi:hypothetical protein
MPAIRDAIRVPVEFLGRLAFAGIREGLGQAVEREALHHAFIGESCHSIRTCTPNREARYWRREVGGGRTSRQPGQIRKEAAVTSFRAGRSPASHCFLTDRMPL